MSTHGRYIDGVYWHWDRPLLALAVLEALCVPWGFELVATGHPLGWLTVLGGAGFAVWMTRRDRSRVCMDCEAGEPHACPLSVASLEDPS